MLVTPEVATDAEMAYRQKYEITAKHRVTNEELSNELFTTTVVENSLQLAEQFFFTATSEKYRIYLVNSKIVVAKDNSFENIYDDWIILTKNISFDKIAGDNKARAILSMITDLVKDQKRLKAELHPQLPEGDVDKESPTQIEDGTVVTEELFENQRSLVVGDYSPRYLIPLADKCGPWSDMKGQPKNKEDFTLPSSDWQWISDWRVDTERSGVDSDGWEYAINWNLQWSAVRGAATYVRRRKWIRDRKYTDPQKKEQEATMEAQRLAQEAEEASKLAQRRGRRLSFPTISAVMQRIKTPPSPPSSPPTSPSNDSQTRRQQPLIKDVPEAISLLLEVGVILMLLLVLVLLIASFIQLSALKYDVAAYDDLVKKVTSIHHHHHHHPKQ